MKGIDLIFNKLSKENFEICNWIISLGIIIKVLEWWKTNQIYQMFPNLISSSVQRSEHTKNINSIALFTACSLK